jgi:hypothetical protein
MTSNQLNLWKNQKDDKWLPFNDAREIARSYCFEYKKEWEEFVTGKLPEKNPLPDNIPHNPDEIYHFTGWRGWLDWLVQPEDRKLYSSFFKSSEFIISLKLKSVADWKIYCKGKSEKFGKKPKNIFTYPDIAYKNKGWESWEDWLGIDLFMKDKKEMIRDLPEGAELCKCKGLMPDCTVCDGKGYYFP